MTNIAQFFPDNWVISYYMGTTVNLANAWNRYKAAKAALNNTLMSSNVKKLTDKIKQELKRVLPHIQKADKKGALTEDTILDQSVTILNLLKVNLDVTYS